MFPWSTLRMDRLRAHSTLGARDTGGRGRSVSCLSMLRVET